MDEAEVAGEEDVVEIVVVVVDLGRGELTLVDDDLVAQRADVEPIGERDGVGGVLPEDVELTLKILFVKRGILRVRTAPVAIGGGQDDDRLEDQRFAGESGGTQDAIIARDVTQPKTLRLRDSAIDSKVALCSARTSAALGLKKMLPTAY